MHLPVHERCTSRCTICHAGPWLGEKWFQASTQQTCQQR